MAERSITTKWLLEHGYVLGPDGWYKGVAPAAPLPRALTEPHPKHGSQAKDSGEAPRPPSRYRVCITSFRCRLLDPDNLFVKWVVDGLRYSRVIPDDSPDHIELVIRQVKVARRAAERTEVFIAAA